MVKTARRKKTRDPEPVVNPFGSVDWKIRPVSDHFTPSRDRNRNSPRLHMVRRTTQWRIQLSVLRAVAGVIVIIVMSRGADAEELVGKSAFDQSVLPELKRYCADCHLRETSEGRWAFDQYPSYLEQLADQKAWRKVRQLVAGHIMPPHGATAPTLAERRTLLDWIDNAVFYVDPNRPDPGELTLRRLNRSEYNNTIRDIFNTDLRPADQFPTDDSGYGFDNIADVLTISPLHMEKYLAAGRDVAREMTRIESPPRVGIELTADKLSVFGGAPKRREKELVLREPADRVGTTVQFPTQSVYRVVARSVKSKGETQPQRIEVLCDDSVVSTISQAESAFALVELPAGEHRIALRRQPAAAGFRAEENAIPVRFMGIAGPSTPMPPSSTDYLRQAAKGRPVGTPELRLSGEDLDQGSGRTSLDTGRAWFASNGYRHAPVLFRKPGQYRMRFKVGAQQAGDEPVRFEIRVADQTIGPFAVTARAQAEQWIETQCQLPAGEYDWQVWFINEHKDARTGMERWFWLHEFTIEGPSGDEDGLSRDEVLEQLKRTGRRLFREPLSDNDSGKITRLVDSALTSGESTVGALRVGLEGLLGSPKFLYHPIPRAINPANNAADTATAPVDERTLASRMSYFLWSTTPDEELLKLTEQGQLRTGFATQVKRMLGDSKSDALATNFAGQWLQLRNLERVAPDPAVYPDFNAELAADMRRETELVFNHILQNNRSVLEFLDADYTFVNARLAKHYGLPAPSDGGFQRVSLTDTERRGVVTHASILTITSLPTRTSPVIRGKWLLEQMMGDEPPPPPGNIPPLPVEPENERLPLRTRLEQHRKNPMCASCHAMLDPLGFALENYDGIGRWRATDANHPVDSSGSLISGETFSDWSDLRDLLVDRRRDDFARCFIEHLLTYALGRGLTYKDKLAVNEILARGKHSNYAFQDLILAICESVPFQYVRINR